MRKSNLLAVAALALSVVLASCNSEGEANKQQLYNNATRVDSEGYTFFKTVYQKASYELAYADYAAANGAPTSLTNNIKSLYAEILPEIEALAADAHVIVPDPGQAVFAADEVHGDSTQVFVASDYQARFVKEQQLLVDQFKRASRNTYKPLREYAQQTLPRIQQLYADAGGEEAPGAHH